MNALTPTTTQPTMQALASQVYELTVAPLATIHTPLPRGETARTTDFDARRNALRLSLLIAIEAADLAREADVSSLLRDLLRGGDLVAQLGTFASEATRAQLDDTAAELAEDLARIVEDWGADGFAHAPLPHEQVARGLAKMRDDDLPRLARALRQVKRGPAMMAACAMIGGAA